MIRRTIRVATPDLEEDLFWVCKTGNQDCVESLLRRGAKPTAECMRAAWEAGAYGKECLELLLKNGGDPNATLEGRTLLERAGRKCFGDDDFKHVEVITTLLESGAVPSESVASLLEARAPKTAALIRSWKAKAERAELDADPDIKPGMKEPSKKKGL
ncbi:MAG: hypothetical protein Q8R98_25370 [Rubrivivax sp.]|nr:hypothetical protein [Rubrivivax sp.]